MSKAKIWTSDEMRDAMKHTRRMERASAISDFIKLLDELIEYREGERKNNNIFRRGTDNLNDDFIENLEQMKSKLNNPQSKPSSPKGTSDDSDGLIRSKDKPVDATSKQDSQRLNTKGPATETGCGEIIRDDKRGIFFICDKIHLCDKCKPKVGCGKIMKMKNGCNFCYEDNLCESCRGEK